MSNSVFGQNHFMSHKTITSGQDVYCTVCEKTWGINDSEPNCMDKLRYNDKKLNKLRDKLGVKKHD